MILMLLFISLACTGSLKAGETVQKQKDAHYILELGRQIPEDRVKPFEGDEKPRKDQFVAYKVHLAKENKTVFKVARITLDEPALFGGYHIQTGYDKRTNLPLPLLYKIYCATRLKARL